MSIRAITNKWVYAVTTLIATVGRQIPSTTCPLMDVLNLEKTSGYLLQNPLKLEPKPCLTDLIVPGSKVTVTILYHKFW